MFKIVYMDMHRMIELKPWNYSSNITEPGYHAGLFPPHYPVPVTAANTSEYHKINGQTLLGFVWYLEAYHPEDIRRD